MIIRGSIRTEHYENKEGKDVFMKYINAEKVDFVSIPNKTLSTDGESDVTHAKSNAIKFSLNELLTPVEATDK